MDRSKLQQMQQDRIDGNFTFGSEEEQLASLRAMGADNWRVPPLEPAPCVRFKATGEIHPWAEFFSKRPDLCESCDENGNTDPAAWRGKSVKTQPLLNRPHPPVSSTSVEDNKPRREYMVPKVEAVQEEPVDDTYTRRPSVPVPAGIHFFPDDFVGDETQGPQMEMSGLVLGKDTPSYNVGLDDRNPLPLTTDGPVSAVIMDVFKQQVYR